MVLQRKCGHPLQALSAIGKHTDAPINHTRLSPCKHSPDGTTRKHPITAYYSFINLEWMKG